MKLKLHYRAYSLAELARATGYHKKQLKRAARETGTTLRKAHARSYAVGWRTAVALVKHLAAPLRFKSQPGTPRATWATKWDCCRRCTTDGTRYRQRHAGGGLCGRCWRRQARREGRTT